MWKVIQNLMEEKDGQRNEVVRVKEELEAERFSRNKIIWSMAEDLCSQRDVQRQEIGHLKRQLAGWKELAQDIGRRVQDVNLSRFK